MPIPEHQEKVNRLTESRITRGTNFKLANDIIDFLQVEDSRMGITFLTEYCEEIPSKLDKRDVLKCQHCILRDVATLYTRGWLRLPIADPASDLPPLAMEGCTRANLIVNKDYA